MYYVYRTKLVLSFKRVLIDFELSFNMEAKYIIRPAETVLYWATNESLRAINTFAADTNKSYNQAPRILRVF